MPIVQVNLIEGRGEDKVEAMIREVTHALATTLDAPPESIRIIVNAVPSSHWGIGGVTAKAKGR
jgi:4-oxalocrotonate tautomerase